MVKRFISVGIILIYFITVSNLFSSSKDDIRFYQIKIRLCRQIYDKGCELKYYSYLYDIADDKLKKVIKNDVLKIISNLNKRELKKIKLNKFKKNWVYYALVNNFYKTNVNINRIKVIGLCIPLSGEFKFIGENILKGILVGINFFENPLDVKIKLFDTMKISSGNLDKLKEFLNNNKDIQIITGFPIKKISESAINILKKAKLPVIFLNDDFTLADSSPYFFNHFININDEMKKLCEIIKGDNINNLAVLYPKNLLGDKYKSAFFNNCNLLNVKTIIGYEPSQTDFRNILFEIGKIRKIKENIFEPGVKIDGFLILDRPEEAIVIIPQIYFYDFKSPKIYGIDLWNDDTLYKLDKRFLKNITFVDCIDYKITNPLKKIYNKKVDFYSILAYDTITIITQLSGNIINELHSKVFSLISGDTYFDEKGISHKKMIAFRINFGGENDKEKR